jgi:Uma2 family endonuclease
MTSTLTPSQTETWINADWDSYIQAIEAPTATKFKGYYHNRQMRIESMPTGSDHADIHAILIFAVILFATLEKIPLKVKDNCSYRKIGEAEFQPDFSCYIGANAKVIPKGTRVIDLKTYPLPDLVVEISDTTLADDQGEKRLQYEELGITEYWVVNVQTCQILAFAIANQGSHRIQVSQVLTGLSIDLLEETLRRSQDSDQSEVSAWLLEKLSP